MAQLHHHFDPAFVGGEEIAVAMSHSAQEEARGPYIPLDLTDYEISAEVWWEGCRRFNAGIEIVDLNPSDTSTPHYWVTLSEQQTMCIPLGEVAHMRLVRVSPDGITTIRAPLWLSRKA